MWTLFFVLVASAEPAPELVSALSARHVDQDCTTLIDVHGVDALVAVADEVSMPPWAPLRAAYCVGTVAAAGGEPAVRRWLADPLIPGLAAASVAGLEAGELPDGLQMAVKARLGDARFVRAARLESSRHAPLRALVVAP